MIPAPLVNFRRIAGGKVVAVCEFCGIAAPPTKPGPDGEPDLWQLPQGWQLCAWPADERNPRGGWGSTWRCPACAELAAQAPESDPDED